MCLCLSLITGLLLSGPLSYKFRFRLSVQKNGLTEEGRHEGLVPRTMFSEVVSYDFPSHEYFWYLSSALPEIQKALRVKKAIYVVRSDSIIGVTLRVLSLFVFKSVDMLALGNSEEMVTLHTNPHAVYGRLTLKDDSERQFWNAGAVS